MGDKTLNERVGDLERLMGEVSIRLENEVGALKVSIADLISGVVLVEKRKPGPAHKTVKKAKSRKRTLQPRKGWVPPEKV